MPNPTSPAGDDDTGLASTIDQAGTAGAASPDDSGAAGSSTAEDDQGAKKPELDLEAVVRKAAKEASSDAEATPAAGKGSEGNEPVDDSKAADPTTVEKTDEEKAAEQAAADAKLPFHKHPRWQEVLKERDGLRAERDSVKEQLSEVSGKAEQFDLIGSFMRDNELTPQEVQQGFEIMALMKHDPAAALEKLAPRISLLELASGQRLPSDLQQKVDAGEVTAEVAQQAAKDRMDAVAARHRAERSETQVQVTQVTQAATAMRTAVETWEDDVKARDPDYPHLQKFVADRARALMAQSPPRNVDDAVALAKRAYADVKADMRKALPQRTATAPAVTTTKSSTTAVAVPSSLEDVVRGALRS